MRDPCTTTEINKSIESKRTNAQTDRQTDRQTDTHTHTYTHTHTDVELRKDDKSNVTRTGEKRD